ncbi:GNAT family N-acetyltransferase [Rhizobium sp. KVB221]|uniref:GNAT family N-acetyltransferase n=1 Tax=Rhizobium setariae TaxID=2801340 RepID=A0A937CNV5_9HYPH|nr:GNAT family N-acetyltransferase [Rhizobium setariae]
MMIRPAISSDFAALNAIELDAFETLRAAGAVFGEAIASGDEELLRYLETGVLLAAVNGGDVSVGYAGALCGDGWLHIGELDVHPDWQRRGIGRRLMRAMLDEGRARGLACATLTTDRFAPFNAAFYSTLGFRMLEASELPDRLAAILAKEHAAGLDPARRVAMQLDFQP